jgi:hypothetical protein
VKKTLSGSDPHYYLSAAHTLVYDEYDVPQNELNIKHDNDWKGKNFRFHETDGLETYVCTQIKAGKLNPKDAFNRIANDWVKFYLDVGLDSKD